MERLAEEVRRDLAPETGDRIIHWRIGPLPEVQGDPALLLLVLRNLVSNAVKYTQPRVEAEIEIAGRCEDQQVVFHVRDNGAGFDMALRGQAVPGLSTAASYRKVRRYGHRSGQRSADHRPSRWPNLGGGRG